MNNTSVHSGMKNECEAKLAEVAQRYLAVTQMLLFFIYSFL